MAGTQEAAEGLPGFRVSTLRATDSSIANSLEGAFQVNTIQNGAVAFVVADDTRYRWDDTSVAAPSDPNVIIPLGQSTGVAGRWLIIPSGGGGGSTGVVLSQVRYVDQGVAPTTPDGSIAAPFQTIEAALDSFTVGELADPRGYVVVIVPGDYTAEDLALPGSQGATLEGYGGTYPKGVELGNILSFTGTGVTLRNLQVEDVELTDADLFLDNALAIGDISLGTGRFFSFGAIVFYGDANVGNILSSSEVNSSNALQQLSSVITTGQLQLANTQVLGEATAAALVCEATSFILIAPGDLLTIDGSIDFENGQCLLPIVHNTGGAKFVDVTFGNDQIMETNDILVQMFGCNFGTDPEVVFLGSAGTLLLDPVSHYFWISAGGVVTNGSVVVAA